MEEEEEEGRDGMEGEVLSFLEIMASGIVSNRLTS